MDSSRAGVDAVSAPVAATGVAVLLVALTTAPAAAQQQGVLDQGTYRITISGRAVGTEAFGVRREGRDIRAVGRVRLDTAVSVLPSMEAWLQTDAGYRPTLFRLRPRTEGPESYTAVREADRIRLRTTTGEGERYREFLAPEGLALFDPRLAHHWYLVLRPRSDALTEGAVELEAILPARGEQIRMEIRRTGEEEVTAAGRRVTATRHEVTGGLAATVWTGEDGRVLRLSLPGAELVSERISQHEEGS